MTKREILIDTGAIYAFVVKNDRYHEAARKVYKKYLAANSVFLLSEAVFFETMTLLKGRTNPAVAIAVGTSLRTDPCYRWLPLERNIEESTWEIFCSYSDKEWSYTDCALFAIAQHYNVPKVFSFDLHFEQMKGIERLPKISSRV